MRISDFKLAHVYTRDNLIDAFKGSFMRGMNYCSRTNSLVLISKHTSNRIYGDEFRDDMIIYTGEGQIGDQQYTHANKRLEESNETNLPVYLFVVREQGKYIYYGKVQKVHDSYYAQERDVEGNMRNVIKFQLTRINSSTVDTKIERIADFDETSIRPTIQVVGAAIIQDNSVLCAQRREGKLNGKWEFPGGKIEPGETPEQALQREIEEELGIQITVEEKIDNSYYESASENIDLTVYKCAFAGGEISNNVHSQVKWIESTELENLDWADADKPIAEAVADLFPSSIVGEPEHFDYFEARPVEESGRILNRAVQDYERSQKKKTRSGNNAELATLRYERDKLNNAGRPDLADKVKQVSKKSSDYGYDVLSYENINGEYVESHIEVKSVKKTNNYIEFFISEHELKTFKNDNKYKIYCLYRNGREYKLHIVNKNDFFSNNYLTPLTYIVRIRISND